MKPIFPSAGRNFGVRRFNGDLAIDESINFAMHGRTRLSADPRFA
jgi:hypothetical protein